MTKTNKQKDSCGCSECIARYENLKEGDHIPMCLLCDGFCYAKSHNYLCTDDILNYISGTGFEESLSVQRHPSV